MFREEVIHHVSPSLLSLNLCQTTVVSTLILYCTTMYNLPITELATVLDVRRGKNGSIEAYVSYAGKDKRLDAWVEEKELGEEVAGPSKVLSSDNQTGSNMAPNRATSEAPESSRRAAASLSVESSPEREHATLTRVRNFEDVRFGEYLIKTWSVNILHLDSCRTRELTKRRKVLFTLSIIPRGEFFVGFSRDTFIISETQAL